MFRIYVKGFGTREMEKLNLNMRRATYSALDKIASRAVDIIRGNIEAYQLIWRGLLLDSVRAYRIKRSAIGISTIFYGPMLERGHLIPPGKKIPTLVAWAREKLPSPEIWLAKVYREGHEVKARPFISDSLISIKYIVPEIMKIEIEKGGKV